MPRTYSWSALPGGLVLMLLTFPAAPSAAQAQAISAHDLLARSLTAMGGAEWLESLRSMRITGIGHENALEQSERPTGPWLPTYRQFTELRDLAHVRLRRTQAERGFWSADWATVVSVADTGAIAMQRGERWIPAPGSLQANAMEAIALAPERILLTARDAADTKAAGDTLLQGVPHDIVSFTWAGRAVRLFLNRYTHLPAGYSVPASTGDVFEVVWGDTPTVTLWSLWSLEPGGHLYPRQWDRERLGQPYRRELLTAVAFDAAAPVDSFGVPPRVRTAYAAVSARSMASMRPGDAFRGGPAQVVELATGVVTRAGAYATTFVEQPDGIIVLDAPMTSAWSDAVIAEAQARFPGKPVKLVVSTSDAWLHIGGLREYAARGIPILALDLNLAIVEHLLQAPRLRNPDAWAVASAAGRSPDLRGVSEPMTIGSGPNRLEIFPVRGEGGERMVLVWWPQHRILYASDLVQIGPDGSAFWPEYLLEVSWVVERQALDPVTVFAMHTPPIPWTQVQDLINQDADRRRE